MRREQRTQLAKLKKELAALVGNYVVAAERDQLFGPLSTRERRELYRELARHFTDAAIDVTEF